MNNNTLLRLLQQNMNDLEEAKKWLERSFDLCQKIGIKEKYSPAEFDAFENLTSRFARTTDFIINKVFRSIDKLELETSGTVIDVLNRAHKRGIIQNVSEIRGIKELRNEIAHEYTNRDLAEIFKDVLSSSAKLFVVIEAAKKYCNTIQILP